MVNAVALVLVVAASHPLHSSLTTVTWKPESRTLELAVRVFTEDLEFALARPTRTPCAYAQAALTLQDGSGNGVSTSHCTVTRQGNVTWIQLRAATGHPRDLRLSNTVLFDRFRDQINIVQTSIEGRSRTVLFTWGDGPKALT